MAKEFTASKGRTNNVNTAKVYGNALKALVVPEKKAEEPAAAPAQPVKKDRRERGTCRSACRADLIRLSGKERKKQKLPPHGGSFFRATKRISLFSEG